MKAKSLSLLAQLIGAVWIVGWSTYRFVQETPTVREIVISGLFIAAVFSPVYFNLVMDKFVNRVGKKEKECVE